MERQEIMVTGDMSRALTEAVAQCPHDRLFILTDTNTSRLCLPLVAGTECLRDARTITIAPSDTNKTLDSAAHVWTELGRQGATRHSLMINIGGGMVTDLGGFAASTFKRGIPYINIPTTLLAMVDASVGGKTGINFGGLKNEIGVFSNARTVIIDTVFLNTMDTPNILSGYAEMLKHGLISGCAMWNELIAFDIEHLDVDRLRDMVAASVHVKEAIVERDPTESGPRKALNIGHTVGHAFEALALRREHPVLHGYAVAYGLVCELYLSVVKTQFPVKELRRAAAFIREHYGTMSVTCDDYDTLLELMTHDKKNIAGTINFTLLGGVGDVRINQTADREEITEALDFYREGL